MRLLEETPESTHLISRSPQFSIVFSNEDGCKSHKHGQENSENHGHVIVLNLLLSFINLGNKATEFPVTAAL